MTEPRHKGLIVPLVVWAFILGSFPLFGIESASQNDAPPISLLVNTAQNSAINCLVPDAENGLLFSASSDGSVNVYANGKDLIQHLQISTDPLINLAISSDGKMAVIEQTPGNHYRLSLWDWKDGIQIWNAAINDQVLSLAFSPRGNLVVLTLARWNSLLFIEAKTGAVQPWLQQGFGIIDYALVSAKEERVLSYHATSGSLSYHELASSSEIKRMATRPKMRLFKVIPDASRTRAVALDGARVVVIDLLTGKLLDAKDPGFPISQIICDESNPTRLIVLGGPPAAARSQSYGVDLQSGTLTAQESAKISLKNGLSAACLLRGQLFVGDRTGLVSLSLGKDSFQSLADHSIANVIGLGFADGLLYLSTSSGFIKIQTDLTKLQATAGLTISLPKSRIIPGMPTNCGVANLNDRELLLWDRTKSPKLYRFDPKLDNIVRSSSAGSSSYIRVKTNGDQCLTVDAGGQVRKIDTTDFRVLFSHNTLGALSLETLAKNEVLVGKGASGDLDASLLRINEKTGETVALNSPDTAVFLIRSNPKTKALYYLASSQDSGKSTTALKKLPFDGLELPAQTLMAFPGEDLGADIAITPESSTVYTSAGRSLVSAWDDKGLWNLEETAKVPRELRTWGKLLFAINQDGSLSIWDTESRKLLMDLFVLNSGKVFFLTRTASYGLMAPFGSTWPAIEEGRDRAIIEAILSLPASMRDKGAQSIRPVQYPLQLP